MGTTWSKRMVKSSSYRPGAVDRGSLRCASVPCDYGGNLDGECFSRRESEKEEISVNEKYVDGSEQLVVELYARDLTGSCVFYQALGFQVLREEEDFVEMQWEGTRFMLDARNDLPPLPKHPVGNI